MFSIALWVPVKPFTVRANTVVLPVDHDAHSWKVLACDDSAIQTITITRMEAPFGALNAGVVRECVARLHFKAGEARMVSLREDRWIFDLCIAKLVKSDVPGRPAPDISRRNGIPKESMSATQDGETGLMALHEILVDFLFDLKGKCQ